MLMKTQCKKNILKFYYNIYFVESNRSFWSHPKFECRPILEGSFWKALWYLLYIDTRVPTDKLLVNIVKNWRVFQTVTFHKAE
jgi:hypothetical protein